MSPDGAPGVSADGPGRHSVLVVAAYDSQLKWGASIGRALAARGWAVRYAAPTDLRTSISPAQVAAAGIADDVARHPWADLLALAEGSDAVVLALQGPVASRFVDELVLRREACDAAEGVPAPAPVVVTGWVGIIIEKQVAGYLERCASDVVAVSSRADLRVFEGVAGHLGLPTDNLTLTGLPLLPAVPAEPRLGAGERPRTLVFADQPTIPEDRPDRLYLYERLVGIARRHPDVRVLLKPRHRPSEDTFHVMRHHPERLLAHREVPPNFAIVYEPVSALLDAGFPDAADVLLTVSSTAGLEAVGQGVRTVFVADLGVHEDLGNHVLVASGLLRTLDQVETDLDAGTLPLPEPAWLDDWFVGRGEPDGAPRTPAERVADAVEHWQAVPPAERPLARASATDVVTARRRRRAHQGPVGGGNGRLRGTTRLRVVGAADALLPPGWREWPVVEKVRAL